MNEPLSVAENRILTALLTDGGAVEQGELDAEVLRGLEERGLVRCLAGFAIISNRGREILKSTPSPESPWTPKTSRAASPAEPARDAAEPPSVETNDTRPAAGETPGDDAAPKLNALQEDLLRRAVLGGEPLLLDDLDGRVVRALEGRGLVRRAAGVLEVTEAGREFYDRHVRRRRRARSGWLRVGSEGSSAPPPADAAEERRRRADELRRAIAALEQALSGETMIDVGGEEKASVAEALVGLRELAERVERGEDPRRITRRRPD
jgi:hypothetical protein